ncbi:hypothetical protein F5B20DRAFT_532157 [Whalleya microplaca]|nr:hypothetical protein F5B20DRAFT_532157 [Whalleya microplaca]
MPKKRNPRGGGRFRGPRRGGLSGNEYSSSSNTPAFQGFKRAHGYTLAEEARNTAHHRRGAFARDAKLRYNPVTFISAGLMNPMKELEVTLQKEDEAQVDQGTAEEPLVASPATADVTPPNNPIPSTTELFTVDVTGDRSLRTDAGPQGAEASEDSDEEVILFKGRDGSRRDPGPAKVNQDDVKADSMKLREIDIEIQVVEKSIQQGTSAPNETVEADDYIPLKAASRGQPKPRKRRKPYRKDSSDEEAAVIADYMANIRNEENDDDDDDDDDDHPGLGSHAFHILRDLGGTDSEAVPDDVSSEAGTNYSSAEAVNSEDQRRRHEAEDERMARILGRQEELGLGGDDILLFDGADSDDEWLSAIKNIPHHKKGASKKAKIFQKKGQYPSASQMADAFDELDLMDWQRPSLNNFNSKKKPPVLDVSDSELEEAMNMAWRKDRLKKAEKKKAREELRSQGLLGKNVNPDDPRVKYRGGMSLDDLANELEEFLLGSQQQLALLPFDKGTRKTIHAVANKFKIKSQSAGKGIARYPVLYRTKATLPFDQAVFDRTFGRIKQTWFARVDVDEEVVNETRLLKRAEARNGKGRFKGTVTVREGDIVGQHAAELGVENKGRAMLEKMGWTKGMALGSGQNKGIMVPITHVIKKTKAGLGEA